ncbi:MAG: response regulator [Bdellovibrionota bacterium]
MATTLLLADDSPTIAKILKMSLQNDPYEIRAVLTAEEALTELKANPPFFFLVDLSLPEKNGYEFARLIKADPKLRDVRVVLLASAFDGVDEAEYFACGADGIIKKPFDPTELRSGLRKVLEAPPKYSDGSRATGSLSGFMVANPHDGTATKTAPPDDPVTSLLEGAQAPANDADSILAGLLGGGAETPSPAPDKATNPEFTNATVALDFTDEPAFQTTPTPHDVLEISRSFVTPPGGTALIDTSVLQEAKSPDAPPPAPKKAPASAAEAPLSANAQALAAFFDAEIKAQPEAETSRPLPTPGAPAEVRERDRGAGPAEVRERDRGAGAMPEMPVADPFDASLSSIEWTEGPAEASLTAWSSSQPKSEPKRMPPPKAAVSEKPPPFKAAEHTKTTSGFTAMPPPGSAATNASSGPNLMFDTGGASFRFSEDYINRITKSFTGAEHETIPESHHMPHAEAAPFFPQQSDDRPAPAPAPAAPAASPLTGGGGAWSDGDVQKIEQIVREEVQMVVREVAEKIAWEVIPELAENLIRKELERVLKEMGQ